MLKTKIQEWLESQGYPLEMRVARAMQRRRFRVFQSEYYRDVESGAHREIDVVASAQRTIHGLLTRISFVVECKAQRDKPWVIFTTPPGLKDAARFTQRAASRVGLRLLSRLAGDPYVNQLPAFRLSQRAGYAMTQAFTDKRDVPFEAAMAVSKAALATARQFDNEKQYGRPPCEIAFPCIIIMAPLFECHLSDAGEPVVTPTTATTLLWRNPIVGMPHTIIHLLTEDRIETFADECRETVDTFFAHCGDAVSFILANPQQAV